jgi:putative aldouronate transport system permease protein
VVQQTGAIANLGPGTAVPRQRTKGQRLWAAVKRDRKLYVLALPGIIFFLLFKYVPMWGVMIAFKNYSPYLGFLDSPWAGLDHFQRFFQHPDFWKLFRNTLAINLLNLIFFFPLPILLSLMLNEVRQAFFKKTVQSIVYLPHFLSWVIISGITFLLFSKQEGIVNRMLVFFGLEKFDFLTNPDIFWGVLTAQSIWKESGWGTIIFLAAIAGVNTELYEAAKIDGASRLRQMWHITLPAIRNVIVVLLILKIGHIMDVGFEHVYLMMNGAVSEVADVFDTYVFRLGVQQGQFSFSTAVGLFKSVVGLLLVLLANWLSKRFGEDGVF